MLHGFFFATRRYIGFDDRDCANLRALAPAVAPHFPAILDGFYDKVAKDPSARALFNGGNEQITRHRGLLATWLSELFGGTYDADYCKKRLKIGIAHFRAGVQQQYMFCGMEIIWQELERLISTLDIPEPAEKRRSLHKLLTLELANMLEGYKEAYAEGIRESERSAVEEKLTRAQHLAEIGQLAASLAHEIKNPLAGISGAIQIIRDTMAPDDRHQPIVSEILGQIDRLDATVKDLLLYARPTPPQRTRFPMATVVNRVLKILREGPELQRVHVECVKGPRDTTVYADDRQIEQLIINLILNATHASADGEAIQVAITRNADYVRLTVKDTGRGMTHEVQKQAFEPFYTTKAKGTGLGLSICRRIVEAHGGNIQLESELRMGTTATVDLPPGSKSTPEDQPR